MIIKISETPEERGKRLAEWHNTFAWLPKKTGPREMRWLEPVQRRAKNMYHEWHEWSPARWGEWEYRSMAQALKELCADDTTGN